MAQMQATTVSDIAGLRQQIIANATVLFPPASPEELDVITLAVQTSGRNGAAGQFAGYQAVLVSKRASTATVPLARGAVKSGSAPNSPDRALGSLLYAVSQALQSRQAELLDAEGLDEANALAPEWVEQPF